MKKSLLVGVSCFLLGAFIASFLVITIPQVKASSVNGIWEDAVSVLLTRINKKAKKDLALTRKINKRTKSMNARLLDMEYKIDDMNNDLYYIGNNTYKTCTEVMGLSLYCKYHIYDQ